MNIYMNNAPKPSAINDYVLSESVGYLISRVRSTMWNGVTQHTTSQLGITGTEASIMFMLAVSKCAMARISPVNTGSMPAPSRV